MNALTPNRLCSCGLSSHSSSRPAADSRSGAQNGAVRIRRPALILRMWLVLAAGLLTPLTQVGRADEPVQPSLLAAWPNLPAVSVNHTWIDGSYAYLALSPGGLLVADVRNAANPRRIGNVELAGLSRYVRVIENRALVAANDAGLQIVDVANPSKPVLLGAYKTSGPARWVSASGQRAFVAADFAGLQIIDVSHPSLPKELGTYQTRGEAKAVEVFGNYALITCRTAVDLVDVSNPSLIRHIVYLSLEKSSPVSACVKGGFAYLAFAGVKAGLQIVDIRSPEKPKWAGAYYSGNVRDVPFGDLTGATNPTSIVVRGSFAYISTDTADLQIVDVSNPATASAIARFSVGGVLPALTVANGCAYISAMEQGLKIADITSPSAPKRIGALETQWNFVGLDVRGGLACALDAINGFQVLDVSDVAHPARLGVLPMAFEGKRVRLSGNYALIADGTNGLRFVDIGTPSAPRAAGGFLLPGSASDVTVSGRLAYVACGKAGLVILDINQPAIPRLLGQFDTAGTAIGVAVAGGYAYVADGSAGIQIVDVSDPTAPGRVGGLTFPNGSSVHGISARDGRVAALIMNPPDWVSIFDISDPVQMKPLGNYNHDFAGSLTDVIYADHFAFVAHDTGFAQVDPTATDISNTLGQFHTNLGSWTLAFESGRVYLGGRYGIDILAVSSPQPVEGKLQIARSDNQTLTIGLSGPPRTTWTVEASSDLSVWHVPAEMEPVTTNDNGTATLRVSCGSPGVSFYRGVLVR
jgi:hypothetical protein